MNVRALSTAAIIAILGFQLPSAWADVAAPRADALVNDPKDGQTHVLPFPLPDDLQVSGEYRFTVDSERGVVRFTGRVRLRQGKSWIQSLADDGWVEFDKKGTMRTSQSKWEISVVREDTEK